MLSPELQSDLLGAVGLRFSGQILGHGAQGIVLDSDINGHQCATKLSGRMAVQCDEDVLSRTSTGGLSSHSSDDATNSHSTLRHEASVLKLVHGTHGHANVVGLVDFVEGEEYSALVLERFGSCDLFTKVQRVRAQTGLGLDEQSARNIFSQILCAVMHVHSKGVCHRDLKLENVLLDEDTLHVKLIDFGLSQILADPTGKEAGGRFKGTLEYSAPELVRGHRWNGESVDVFSLGVLLFAMLYGSLPSTSYGRGRPFGSKTPAGVQQMICRMLSRDQAMRPSMQEIAEDPWLKGAAPANQSTRHYLQQALQQKNDERQRKTHSALEELISAAVQCHDSDSELMEWS